MTRAEIAAAILTIGIVGATLLLVAYLPQALLVAEHHPVALRLVGTLLPTVSMLAAIAAIVRGVRHRKRNQ
jgi:hypothetical protein